VVIIAVVGSVAVLGWLYMGAQHKLDAQARQSADNAHAEKIALDYAVNAAAMDFQDINAWKVKLVAGTTPELNDKLTKAATSIEQILVPLQWTSTAKPLVAKVHSHTGSTYVVDAFVSVMTKTIQAPEPLQSTATYSVTLDSSKDWKISDVGGIGAAVEEK
jgi:Mce-associated membrane protein